ncbi:MAG TPA: nuclear transport factor 2 family protein [Cytophagales bacterium]|jgi:ketosteroid isomerase-like protein|nr:nuclear transport factor 2 family protein [Cytophagales bacterium]
MGNTKIMDARCTKKKILRLNIDINYKTLTVMTYFERARDFQAMQDNNQVMEAFEKYYADNCIITEMPTREKREGKDAQRKAIEEWFELVEELHDSGVRSITADEENAITCCEVWYDATYKGMGRSKMEEVAIQKWEGDKIIEERFYYHSPG